MVSPVPFVVAANAVSLVVGSVITHLAYRAYRRTRSPPLRALSVGFGVVTLGVALGGGAHQVVGLPVLYGVLIQSVLTAIGFVVLAHSLYRETPDGTQVTIDRPGGRRAD